MSPVAEQNHGTPIEWTQRPGTRGETWNPIRSRDLVTGKNGWHCEKISPGCKRCYAETLNKRNLPGCGTGKLYTIEASSEVEMFIHEPTLAQPLGWTKPRTIFVESMSDLFGRWVTDGMLDRIFAVMALCQQHTFIVLTKRSERLPEYITAKQYGRMCAVASEMEAPHSHRGCAYPLPNVWLGVSVENQEYADKRIPHLLRTPAARRFISYEPALGPLDLQNHTMFWAGNNRLDWVIVGGESGPGARRMDPMWARAIIAQCKSADVACFVKQLGRDLELRKDPKGGNWLEWQPDLRVREYPA